MLTLRTMIRAMRLARSYGDTTSHYFDGRDESSGMPARVRADSTPSVSGFIRQWNEEKGAYEYVQIEAEPGARVRVWNEQKGYYELVTVQSEKPPL